MVHVITDNIFLLSDNFTEYYGNELSAQKSFFFFFCYNLSLHILLTVKSDFDGFDYHFVRFNGSLPSFPLLD